MNILEGRQLAVIGDPIRHSLSPVIHQAMLDALGVHCTYGRIRVRAGETAAWLEQAEKGPLAGFNATMPHKTDLVPLMDTLSGDARMCRSVNTVVLRDGKRHGCSTDGEGFLRSLRAAGIDPCGMDIAVLGAGGAARSIVLKLDASRAGSISVLCRTPSRAGEMTRASRRIRVMAWDGASMKTALKGAGLLVNCTPLGMDGVDAQFAGFDFLDGLPAHAAVCDVIYRPVETRLLKEAGMRGHTTLNGLGMLIHQAILALELFSGQPLDPAAMEQAVRERLLPELEQKAT